MSSLFGGNGGLDMGALLQNVDISSILQQAQQNPEMMQAATQMCVCVSMCVCMYACMSVCLYVVKVCLYAVMVCMCVVMVCMYVSMCACVYARVLFADWTANHHVNASPCRAMQMFGQGGNPNGGGEGKKDGK